MSEKELQSTLVQAASLTGWLVYHTHDSRRSTPGFPDLTLVHKERAHLAFIECKTEKGRVSVHQQRWLDALDAVAHATVDDQLLTPGPEIHRVHVGIANPETLDSWLAYITRKP